MDTYKKDKVWTHKYSIVEGGTRALHVLIFSLVQYR